MDSSRWQKLQQTAWQYVKWFDSEKTSAYVKDYCGGEAADLLGQAEQILNQIFVYKDKWDMEPCPTPYHISLKDWVTTPNGDEEWVFMLNRHDFMPKLLYAWMLTGDMKYIDKLKWYLFDWIEKNPITLKGTDATRTIDTGIRCMNWCHLLLFLIGHNLMTQEEAEKILSCLSEQFTNMRQRYIGKYSLSNWGVLQTTAMCTGYLWFSEYLPDDLEQWAWEEFKNQLELQILEDGSHWEQSAMYHVEVLNCSARVLYSLKAARELGIEVSPQAVFAYEADEIPDDMEESKKGPGEGYDGHQKGWLSMAVRVLSRHVLYTADPQGNQLAQCDSDVTQISDVMNRAAILLSGGGIYKYVSGGYLDMDSVWLTGIQGIYAYGKTVPVKPEQCSWNCPFGGNLFIRSSWEGDSHFMWLKNSTLGSGHGHTDQTHLTLFYKGYPFLADSGRYTYREDDPLRMELKNPMAHNLCVIDGQSGGNADTSWTNSSCGEVLKNYYCEKEGIHYAELPFHGNLEDGQNYLMIRKLLMLGEGIWLSVYDVSCQGAHELKEYFHMDNDVVISENNNNIVLKNADAFLTMYGLNDYTKKRGIISKRYNELLEGEVLVRTAQMEDRHTSSLVFAGEEYSAKKAVVYQYGKSEPVPEEFITAWDILKNGERCYTLVIWNRETYRGGKMHICHDVPLYGKAAVIKWNGDEYQRIRLKT